MLAQFDATLFDAGGHLLPDLALCTMTAAVTFAAVCALQPIARRLGILDHPAGRKDHAISTPTTGGIAMLLGILLGLALVGHWDRIDLTFAAAALVLVATGVLDDLFDLHWWLRIPVQCFAVWLVYRGGVAVEHVGPLLGATSLNLGAWQLPFTMFATVGVINAINMSDGVDGLAGGIGLATFAMFTAAALYSGNAQLAGKVIVVSGAILGFWLMNMRFPWQARARVFMGNAGSALLGFTIAWACFRLTQNEAHPVSPILGPWLVATPLVDCVVLIGRRLLNGQSPFRADRNHMHHLMLEAGFAPRELTLTVMGINLAFGLLAGLALLARVPEPLLVLAFMLLCVGYFWLTGRRVRAVAFFAWLRHPLRPERRRPTGIGLATEATASED